jgi:hypothetical protein
MLVNFFAHGGGPDRLSVKDGGAFRAVSSAQADPKGDAARAPRYRLRMLVRIR